MFFLLTLDQYHLNISIRTVEAQINFAFKNIRSNIPKNHLERGNLNLKYIYINYKIILKCNNLLIKL